MFLNTGCARYLAGNEPREPNMDLPSAFGVEQVGTETSVATQQQWDEYFSDPYLTALIEEALANNQELNIRLQEIIITQNEVAARRGEYLPRLDGHVGAGIEKVGQHTSQGVSDEANGVAEHLPDFRFGLSAAWEIDVWGKLRNAKKAANYRYLASIEAKNFVVTQIIAELADSYYELLAVNKQIEVLDKNIELQEDALRFVKLQKEAARATELAVQRFHAEVLKNQSRRSNLEQQRIRAENRINFLVGRFPQPVETNPSSFDAMVPAKIPAGIPAELLENRPDIRQAQLELEAAKLDVKAAKARFYPAFSIEAGVGYESFNARHIVDTPQSLAYNLAGNLVAPLLNRAAIKADYRSANARQIMAVYNYERTVLLAYTEVVNQLAIIQALFSRYEKLAAQVDTLQQAIDVSNALYNSARADYMEVLLTRRDSLDAQMELVEAKVSQMRAWVGVYQALGGGWRRQKAPDNAEAPKP